MSEEGPRGGSALRLAIRFLLILGGLNLAYYADKKLGVGLLDTPYTQLVTWVAGHVSAWVLPYAITVTRYSIVAEQRRAVFVASGCNGLEAIFLMIAGIIAYPAPWRTRISGMLRYGALLYALNLTRVVALVHVAHRHRGLMNLAHYQIAQGILILFVLAFWVQYVRGTEQ